MFVPLLAFCFTTQQIFSSSKKIWTAGGLVQHVCGFFTFVMKQQNVSIQTSMFYFAFQGAVTRRFWGGFVCFLLTEVVFMGSYTQRHTHAMDLLDFLLCQVSRHHSQDEDQSCRVFSHWKCKQTRLASGKSEILVESAMVLCWRQFACLTMQKEKFGICNICNNSDVIVRNPPEK